MTYAEMVVFHRLKVGSSAAEMEDGAGYDPGDPATGRNARCIVVDGATEAYDSIRWVNQLVESFLGVDPAGGLPALTDQGMDEWFGVMQQRWLDRTPTTFANIFEERKFRQDGSFATLLACEIAQLDGPRPQLTAVALGDAVLFHIRGGRLIAQFPQMEAADFDVDLDGMSTQPSQRGQMRARLRRIEQVLEIGDQLFLATAPVASWIVRSMATDRQALWTTLDEIVDPQQFDRLATEQLRSGRMKNGDLTLLRVQITEHSPKLRADSIADVSQNVQFTVYRPPVIRPESWYPMLAFAHLAERRPDAPPDEPDPLDRVWGLAVQSLGGQASAYEGPRVESRSAVPKESELTFVPYAKDIDFNPRRQTFQWQEDVHQQNFRLRARSGAPNRVVGQMTIYLGAFILADVDLVFRVDSGAPAAPEPQPFPPLDAVMPVRGRPYRKVFASYSHKDLAIVKQAEAYGAALGDVYLRDRTTLRSGEDWNEKLLNLIEEADVFQLFWSRNSMVSDYVRREWEHALRSARGRESFVRPTYWEVPMPTSVNPKLPPDDLRKLHFHAFHEDPTNHPFSDEDYQSASPVKRWTVSPTPAADSARHRPQAPLWPGVSEPAVHPPALSAPARQSAEQSERRQQTVDSQAAESTHHPPPAPIWRRLSTPLVPPPALSAPARRSAEQSERRQQTVDSRPAQAVPVPVHPAKPREYWILSVIALLFFFIFGAIALYFSHQVGHRYRTGNYVGATKASKLARAWGIAGIVVGGIAIVLYLSQG